MVATKTLARNGKPNTGHADNGEVLPRSKALSPQNQKPAKAYVTGRCCNQCLQSLIQAGVSQIYMANRKGSQLEDKNTLEIFDTIIEETKTQVHFIDYDLKWMEQIINYYKQ